MFEGDLDEGELEIGQIASDITEIKPAAEIMQTIWADFLRERDRICSLTPTLSLADGAKSIF